MTSLCRRGREQLRLEKYCLGARLGIEQAQPPAAGNHHCGATLGVGRGRCGWDDELRQLRFHQLGAHRRPARGEHGTQIVSGFPFPVEHCRRARGHDGRPATQRDNRIRIQAAEFFHAFFDASRAAIAP